MHTEQTKFDWFNKAKKWTLSIGPIKDILVSSDVEPPTHEKQYRAGLKLLYYSNIPWDDCEKGNLANTV